MLCNSFLSSKRQDKLFPNSKHSERVSIKSSYVIRIYSFRKRYVNKDHDFLTNVKKVIKSFCCQSWCQIFNRNLLVQRNPDFSNYSKPGGILVISLGGKVQPGRSNPEPV